jgi:hypothetical protein
MACDHGRNQVVLFAYMTVRMWLQLPQAEKIDLRRDVVRQSLRECQDALALDQPARAFREHPTLARVFLSGCRDFGLWRRILGNG